MTKFAAAALLICLPAAAAMAQQATPPKPAADAAPAAAAAQPAPANPAPAAATTSTAPDIKRIKMGALLSQGYEIKAVSVVSQEISSRLAEKPDRDGVLVTLQKGSSAATCLYSLFDYVQPGMLDIVWCIEQK